LRRSPTSILTSVLAAATLALVVAGVHMAMESAGWLQPPRSATGNFAGHDLAKAASIAALLAEVAAAIGLALVRQRDRPPIERVLGHIVAPLAAAVAVLQSLTYDPYYVPAEHRFIDVHPSMTSWLIVLVVGSLGAVVVYRLRPAAGWAVTAAVATLAAATVFLVPIGH
jgi:hypothetical protein